MNKLRFQDFSSVLGLCYDLVRECMWCEEYHNIPSGEVDISEFFEMEQSAAHGVEIFFLIFSDIPKKRKDIC